MISNLSWTFTVAQWLFYSSLVGSLPHSQHINLSSYHFPLTLVLSLLCLPCLQQISSPSAQMGQWMPFGRHLSSIKNLVTIPLFLCLAFCPPQRKVLLLGLSMPLIFIFQTYSLSNSFHIITSFHSNLLHFLHFASASTIVNVFSFLAPPLLLKSECHSPAASPVGHMWPRALDPVAV